MIVMLILLPMKSRLPRKESKKEELPALLNLSKFQSMTEDTKSPAVKCLSIQFDDDDRIKINHYKISIINQIFLTSARIINKRSCEPK